MNAFIVHFIPYGSYIANCGYIEDKRFMHRQTELRSETTCSVCQSYMTDLRDLPEPIHPGSAS